MTPWQHWYHVTIGTYAQWLPGDPRGWRERDHHEHVDGDYKRPPKLTNFNQKRHEHSRRIMKHNPYTIQDNDKPVIGALILKSLSHQNIPVAAIAVSVKNIHLLIQCKQHNPKPVAGNVKRQITFEFAPILEPQTRQRRPLLEIDCGAKPIRDLHHGKRAYWYILDHREKERAWVWSHRPADLVHIGPAAQRHGIETRSIP